MALQWTTTAHSAASNGVKMLVHAESGSGKTMLCATAPQPVIISAESGLLSLNRANIERVFGPNRPDITYDIPTLPISTYPQLEEAYNFFASGAARGHCKTICLDSISEVAEKILQTFKQTKNDARQAYGEMADRTFELLKKFRDLAGYHVYMAAKQELWKDDSGISRFTVSMPGKQLGPQMPYLFDEVFHLGIMRLQDGRKVRYLRTDQDTQYVAKDRSGRLDEIEEPNLTKIITKIQGVAA